SAGQGADTSPLTSVITRPDWSLLTRVAIWAARVDLPMPPIPYMTSPPLPGAVRSAARRRRSAERMDRDVRWRGLTWELLAWRAACLTLTGRDAARLRSFPGDSPGPGVRAAGISCGRMAAFSCPTRTNLATSTPLPPYSGRRGKLPCIFV